MYAHQTGLLRVRKVDSLLLLVGLGLAGLEENALVRHQKAFDEDVISLPVGGFYRLRASDELHALDGTLIPGQSTIARNLVLRDRGQNIRTPEAYAGLARQAFTEVTCDIRTDMLRVPYTHCILQCTRH